MEKDLGQVFHEMKEDLSAYAEIKFNFYKLTVYEKAGKLVSSLSYVLLLVILGFMATFFLFLALGFLLGDWLNSTSGGIAIVGGIYLIAIGIVVMNRKKFLEAMINNVIDVLDEEEDETPKENNV